MRIRPQHKTRQSTPSVHPVRAYPDELLNPTCFAGLKLVRTPLLLTQQCSHQVWEEEVTLMEMHPNPVVLERMHAAGQLALSNERVLLSGLPVHVLVSVQRDLTEV